MKESQAALNDWTVTSIQHMLRNDSPALAAHPNASISKGGQSCFAASVKEHVHKTFGLSTVPAGAAAHARRGHLHGKVAPHNLVYTTLQVCFLCTNSFHCRSSAGSSHSPATRRCPPDCKHCTRLCAVRRRRTTLPPPATTTSVLPTCARCALYDIVHRKKSDSHFDAPACYALPMRRPPLNSQEVASCGALRSDARRQRGLATEIEEPPQSLQNATRGKHSLRVAATLPPEAVQNPMQLGEWLDRVPFFSPPRPLLLLPHPPPHHRHPTHHTPPPPQPPPVAAAQSSTAHKIASHLFSRSGSVTGGNSGSGLLQALADAPRK